MRNNLHIYTGNPDATADKIQKEDHATAILNSKFKMFFAGLSFATLSFMGAYPIHTTCASLKIVETLALSCLFITGTILLIHLAKYEINNIEKVNKFYKSIIEIIFLREKTYWICFILGMVLMIIDRSALLFLNQNL